MIKGNFVTLLTNKSTAQQLSVIQAKAKKDTGSRTAIAYKKIFTPSSPSIEAPASTVSNSTNPIPSADENIGCFSFIKNLWSKCFSNP